DTSGQWRDCHHSWRHALCAMAIQCGVGDRPFVWHQYDLQRGNFPGRGICHTREKEILISALRRGDSVAALALRGIFLGGIFTLQLLLQTGSWRASNTGWWLSLDGIS